MEDNKYLGNFTNGYKMHNIWRQNVEGENGERGNRNIYV